MSVTTIDPSGSLRHRLAAELRAEMARQRWTGRKLAAEIGRNHGWSARRFNGEVALDADDLEAVCGVLDLSVSELFARVERNWPTPPPGSHSEG